MIFGVGACVSSAAGWDFFWLSMWDLVHITREDFRPASPWFTVTETFENVRSTYQRKNIISGIETFTIASLRLKIQHVLLHSFQIHPHLCLLLGYWYSSMWSVTVHIQSYIQAEHTDTLHISLCLYTVSVSHTHLHRTSLLVPNHISTRWMMHNYIFVYC